MVVEVPGTDAWLPTLAGVSFTAGRFEREMRDLYGIVPRDHPQPYRLVRHGHWPVSYHPMLAEADPHPDFGAAGFTSPQALDVEWFFSAYELANLMAAVQDLSVFSINPGVASPADWQHIAFKGGSEPGVINLTTWLVGQSGMNYCVVATWNNDEVVDEVQFVGLYSGVLRQLTEIDAKP